MAWYLCCRFHTNSINILPVSSGPAYDQEMKQRDIKLHSPQTAVISIVTANTVKNYPLKLVSRVNENNVNAVDDIIEVIYVRNQQ